MPLHFTDALVADLQCPAGQKDKLFFDQAQKGLAVRVTLSGARIFLIQWTDAATRQKRREVLGAFGAITTAQARKAAKAKLGHIALGLDPRAERLAKQEAAKREKAALLEAKAEAAFTLDTLISDWEKLALAQRRPRYRAEACRALRLAFQKDLDKPASVLAKARVLQVLDAYDKGGKHATARLVRAYGRACFGWAVKRGRLASNPFQGLPTGAAAVARDRLLTDAEIGAIWRAACDMAEPAGPFIRLALLTLARREEVAGLRWSEISPDLTVWTIPAQRMKRGQAHVVALTDAAREALGAVTRIDGQDLVFAAESRTPMTGAPKPGQDAKKPISGFSKIKARLDKRSGVSGWVLHDFRRAGASTLARLGFSPIVADKLLAHQPSALSSVARVYQQHDFNAEKAAALEAWAAHVLRCASGALEAGNVADLAKHRAKRGA
jgi:integrase